MALPPSVAERLGRRPSDSSPAFFGQLMFFSIAIFAASVILYGGLKYGYEPYLNGKISDLEQKIATAEKSVTTDDKARLLKLNSEVANLKGLLKDKRSTIELVQWLQGITLSNVRYTSAALNRDVATLTLSGVSKTMEDFTAQLQLFQQDPMVKQAAFSHLAPSKDGWLFDVTLALNDSPAKK